MSLSNTPDLTGRSQGGRKLIAVVHADMVGTAVLSGLTTLERFNGCVLSAKT